MWKLKSCPKCGGDVWLEKNGEEWQEQCLQCSYQREFPVQAQVLAQPLAGGKSINPESNT